MACARIRLHPLPSSMVFRCGERGGFNNQSLRIKKSQVFTGVIEELTIFLNPPVLPFHPIL